MNGYERMIKLMREQGKIKHPQVPKLAEMTGAEECDVKGTKLDKEDLLVAGHLKGKLKKGDTVLVQRIDEETYVIIERLVKL